ncbi:MAG: MaoC family dehydratase [Chloroflexales bacterium]|jgi:acyl dehydratase
MGQTVTVGQKASIRKTITEADVVLFGCVTGDLNPLHTDDIAAGESRFGKRIAHGMIGAGLISAVLGMQMPGPGTIYIKQTLNFRRPIFINDTVTTVVEVKAIREDKPIATLSTMITNQDGDIVLEGESLVLLP